MVPMYNLYQITNRMLAIVFHRLLHKNYDGFTWQKIKYGGQAFFLVTIETYKMAGMQDYTVRFLVSLWIFRGNVQSRLKQYALGVVNI